MNKNCDPKLITVNTLNEELNFNVYEFNESERSFDPNYYIPNTHTVFGAMYTINPIPNFPLQHQCEGAIAPWI